MAEIVERLCRGAEESGICALRDIYRKLFRNGSLLGDMK
jgi:hypothetical protein